MKRWIDSLGYATQGLIHLLKTERNARIQIIISLLVIIGGFAFHVSRIEWAVILLCIGGVMGMEALNTAIEKLCDVFTVARDERIRIIKDISAGAVLIFSIVAIVTGLIIFIPYLIALLLK